MERVCELQVSWGEDNGTLMEWAVTSFLKLFRILYYGAKGLVTHNTHYLNHSFVVEVMQGCLYCLCLEFATAHFILV